VPSRVPHRGDARNLGIGQGQLAATPLQVADMMATLARRGVCVQPTMRLDDPAGPPARVDLKLSPAVADAVLEGLRRVVNGSRGTARDTVRMDDIEVAGKTGTAQAEPLRYDGNGDGRVTGEDPIVPGAQGDHAWFAGFAPLDPRDGRQVAVAVIVEYGGHGGASAGPIAKNVLELCRAMGYLGGQRILAQVH
jgi:penicillin-binding protein 2